MKYQVKMQKGKNNMNLSEYSAKPDKTIEAHVNDLLQQLEILYQLKYIDSNDIYELVKLACYYHDVGKVTNAFQKRVKAEKKQYFDEEKEVAHNVLSVYFIDKNRIAEIPDVQARDYARVCFAVMYHHDYCDPQKIIKEKKDIIQKLLKDFEGNTFTLGMNFNTSLSLVMRISDERAVKIKGYLHKCDYSASGNYIVEYPNDFLEQGLKNCMKKWKEKDLSIEWNPLQQFCMEKQNQNMIVVAQTGMGKTEGGLWWIGNHKGFFILPLRTAINAIYDRIRENILDDQDLSERLCLLHSESLEYYVKKELGTDEEMFEYDQRGKELSIPLSISTIDQLFDFIFKYQGYEMKLTTLSYARIVIDEIQMYSADLLAYLIYGLEHISKMGGKIAIMTATLAPFVRNLLEKHIEFPVENQRVFIDGSIRHNVKVLDSKINAQDILELYDQNENKRISNKILVVCNKVKTAQKLMEQIKKQALELGMEILVHIFHSRFIRVDRAQLEKDILRFGKTYDEKKHIDIQSGIWIATSVVEASLDIDFDYLFTELLDLNSLFQRMGRCNRKGVKSVADINCYIYTKLEEKDFINGKNGFIDRTIFDLSVKAVNDIDGELSENKKQELINQYLTMENIRKSSFLNEFKKVYKSIESIEIYQYKKDENKFRNIFTETIIPNIVYEQHREEINDISQKLTSEKLTMVERKRLKNDILQYSVSVPYYHWIEYESAVRKGAAQRYESVSLGQREKIKIMECKYEELGYEKMEFENKPREAVFL